MTLTKSQGKRCNSCSYPVVYDIIPGQRANNTAAMHWRICEPSKNWPAFMVKPKPLVEVFNDSPQDIEQDTEQTEPIVEYTVREPCECGWQINADNKNPRSAIRMHLMNSKAHKG